MRHLIAALLLAATLALPREGSAATATPPSFAGLVEQLMPAVVNISTTQKVKSKPMMQFRGLPEGQDMEQFREFFEQFNGGMGENLEREVTSLGSGFVIDPEGYIVTNQHVIADADDVTVNFSDNKKYKAKIVGRDPKTDLALLKIEPTTKLPFVPIGDSDALRVGDWVIAIGNPFGLGGSVSAGIVSARSRNINAGPFDDFIQTDAAINRGNSGGPLFNAQGEVIGINSAIFTPTGGNVGIGFAIPSALAQPVIKQLREFGRTHRAWLGVKIQEVSEEIANSLGLKNTNGALVLDVNKGSPAAKAGVEAGDVILTFNGKPVSEMRKLPRMVADAAIGTTVPVTVLRKGKEKTLAVELGELKEDEDDGKKAEAAEEPKPAATQGESYLGMKIAPVNRELRKSYELADEAEGLYVLDIKPNSLAAEQGLQQHDLIVEVNQEKVTSVAQLRDRLRDAKKAGKNHALLQVVREGVTLFVTLPTDAKDEVKKK